MDTTSSDPAVRAPRVHNGWSESEARAVNMSTTDLAARPGGDETVERELLDPLRRGEFGRATRAAWSLVEQWLATTGPDKPAMPADGLTALNRVAAMLYLTGDPSHAHGLWERVIVLARRQPDTAPLEQASAFHGLGTVLHKEGNLKGAERLLRKAWEVRKKYLGEFTAEAASTLNRLAMVRRDSGDREEAETLLRQTLVVRRKVLGEYHPDYALSLNNLGAALMATSRKDEAKDLIERAVELRRGVLGERHPDLASSLSNLAVLCQNMGELDRAVELHSQALDIRREALGEAHPHYVTNLNTLTELLLSRGDLAAALPLLDQTIQRSRQTLSAAMRGPDYFFGADAPHDLSNGKTGLDATTVPHPALAVIPLTPVPDAVVTPDARASLASASPPRRRRSMSATLDDLSRRIQALGAEFNALAGPLAGAATALKEPGTPPGDDLLQRLHAGRGEFTALRECLNEQGAKFGIGPDNGELASLSGLGRFLVRVESEHRRVEQVRKPALNVLDRALGLKHVDQATFAPLQACQEQVRALRAELKAAEGDRLDELAKRITAAEDPLAHLFSLVAGPDSLDDEAWANAYESVAQNYGRPLAVAASRAKLVETTKDPVKP